MLPKSDTLRILPLRPNFDDTYTAVINEVGTHLFSPYLYASTDASSPMGEWGKFVSDNCAYTQMVVAPEKALASRSDKGGIIAQRIVGNEKDKTLSCVSLAPGTNFTAKDGAMGKQLEAQNNTKIVEWWIVETSEDGLHASMAAAQKQFPDASINGILADMYNPALTADMIAPCEHAQQVSFLFGLTTDNVPGTLNYGPSRDLYIEGSRTILNRMAPQSHFITTTNTYWNGDPNVDGAEIEKCYGGQKDIGIAMLQRHGIPTNGIEYEASFLKYSADTAMCARCFVFTEQSAWNGRTFQPGEKLLYHLSALWSLDAKLDMHREAGFQVVRETEPAPQVDNIAMLHLGKDISDEF